MSFKRYNIILLILVAVFSMSLATQSFAAGKAVSGDKAKTQTEKDFISTLREEGFPLLEAKEGGKVDDSTLKKLREDRNNALNKAKELENQKEAAYKEFKSAFGKAKWNASNGVVATILNTYESITFGLDVLDFFIAGSTDGIKEFSLEKNTNSIKDDIAKEIAKLNTKDKNYSKKLEGLNEYLAYWNKANHAFEKYKDLEVQWEDAKAVADAYSDLEGKDNIYYIIYKGQTIYMEKTKDGQYITAVGASVGCPVLPLKLAEYNQCLFCPLFKVIFVAADEMSTKSFETLGKVMANVMMVGFSIYIALKILIMNASIVKKDTDEFLTEILTQAFKVLVAYVLLIKINAVYEYVVTPVVGAGLEFGMSMLDSTKATDAKGTNLFMKTCIESISRETSTKLLPLSLYQKLHCFINGLEQETGIPKAIGSSIMCFATHAGGNKVDVKVFAFTIPDIMMTIQGAIIFIFAWLITLAFAFYLIDATVRLGIVGALMPFLIASWPFEKTAQYTKTGWTMIMNTFFTYVFMGIVISINVKLMSHAMTGARGGTEELVKAIAGDSISKLKEMLDIGFSGFLILIASCLFGFKLTGTATKLADSMAGGGGGEGIGTQIGGTAASAATAGGKMVGGWAKPGVKRGASAVGRKAMSGGAKVLNKIRGK